MEFEDELELGLGKDDAWNLVSDPEVLASCVPGAREVEKISESEYRGTIERSMAGVSVALDGSVTMTVLSPPDYLEANATATDSRTNSRVDADAIMEMETVEEGRTCLSYHIDIGFTGRLATLAGRLVKRKINADIETFFDNIREHAEAEDLDVSQD